MARPNGSTATTDGIDWREARYFARLVRMLVSSQPDRAEYKQDIEHLVSAAAALRAGGRTSCAADHDRVGHPDSPGTADGETESAVLALWRRNPSAVRAESERHRDGATAIEPPCVSCGGTAGVDDAELARAVEEIERAAAALRVDEPGSIATGAGATQRRPLRVWLQIAGLWISIAATTAGMVVGLLVLMR